MDKLLSSGRFFILLAVLASFLASVGTLVWAAWRMVIYGMDLFRGLVGGEGETALPGVHVIATLDTLLLAIVLYIFAIGLYELFLGPIAVPEWLVIRSLDGLKAKLVSVIILVMAVTFVEHLVEWKDPQGTLMLGAATALVLVSLVLYSRHVGKDPEA